VREHDVALVTFEMLVQPHAVAALAQDARQRCLAHLKRPAGAGARVGRADLNNVLEKDMIRGTRWISLTWLGSMLLLAGSLYIIVMSPSGEKWDRHCREGLRRLSNRPFRKWDALVSSRRMEPSLSN
jgi:hypothetical protein